MERLAQQTVGTWPAGVDAEEIVTLHMFSGDVDSSEQTDSVPWSQWNLKIQSNFGKFNRTTAWMLQQVETSVDDPIITDNTCPSPTDEGGDDLEKMAASPPLQVWFGTEVLEALESDNLDVVATTDQHSKTAFRPDVQIEPSEEVPDISKLITSVDTRKVESEFAVRNVTELIVDDGQQCEVSRKDRETVEKQTWLQ